MCLGEMDDIRLECANDHLIVWIRSQELLGNMKGY